MPEELFFKVSNLRYSANVVKHFERSSASVPVRVAPVIKTQDKSSLRKTKAAQK